MAAKMRILTALCALIGAFVIVLQAPLPSGSAPVEVALRGTGMPLAPTTTLRSPIINFTDAQPFQPCEDIPEDVTNGLGLGFTPPEQENSLRCKYDAGNYQMAVEAFVWRDYEHSLPADAVELDVNGHRAAQFWVMKPTDWNDRWWITCMVTFKTSYGVIQQSLFYSPIYSPDGPDCMQENMMRAQQLSPYYKF